MWIVILVIVTMALETGLHTLQHKLGAAGSHMIHKVKDELMIMGVFSLAVVLVEETVGSLDHESKLAFEWAHTLLFLSALVLVLMSVALLVVSDAMFRGIYHPCVYTKAVGQTLTHKTPCPPSPSHPCNGQR